MEIYGMEVEYIGDYKSYKVYAPTTHAFIGKILFIEKQGEFELCDPFTYDPMTMSVGTFTSTILVLELMKIMKMRKIFKKIVVSRLFKLTFKGDTYENWQI